jgi:hypothetical protein
MQSRKRASDPDVAPSGLIHLRYIEMFQADKNGDAVLVKRDSPGRLHQMLAQDTQQQNAGEMDW